MERPTRAAVVSYSLVALGVVTAVQYSGVAGEPAVSLPSSGAWLSTLSTVALGAVLVVVGIAIASRPSEMHRGAERAPSWLLAAAVLETAAFAGLLGLTLVR